MSSNRSSGKNTSSNLLQLPHNRRDNNNNSNTASSQAGPSNTTTSGKKTRLNPSSGVANGRTPLFDAEEVTAEQQQQPPLQLSSRVTFSEESVAADDDDEDEDAEKQGSGSSSGGVILADGTEHHILHVEDENREAWDNKTQFFLGVISYAVGFGNIWRFPALLQKNGGGAFLIPYLLMMLLEGIPLFLIELGIGQRLQTGPVGVWNAIHPYLGGVGVSAAIVSYFVALYYNVILTWVIYYLYKSFRITLPWSTCPQLSNGTIVPECALSSSPTNFFWNRMAIDTTNSISDTGGFTTHITICLVLAWILIYLCVMRGIKTSGKVMYLTATFPYVVTTVFLIRSLALEGAADGLLYMLNPDLSRLYDPEVWLEAATQIFYSMGLGFGGLIAFSSYNPLKNNCKRDCVLLSIANLATSLYTALVIFCVLGYMGHKNYMQCIDKDMTKILSLYPDKFHTLSEVRGNITMEEYVYWSKHNFHLSEFPLMAEHTLHCDYEKILEQAAEGSGLAFVVFTEAILQFPFPPLWSLLFFMMLLMLGLGSMFGTLEGVITSLNDSKMIRVEKPVLTGVLCGSACLVGLIFSTGSGQYWVSLFDHFAGTYALMIVAFFEIFAVIYVYGWRRFSRDLEFMTGEEVGRYWLITWRYISPTIMLTIFTCSVIKSFTNVPKYLAYDSTTTHNHYITYPTWALFIAFGLVLMALAPVPFILFVRKFKIWRVEGDIPAASTFTHLRHGGWPVIEIKAQKCLGSTPSTTYMLKSQMSFNRMVESTASELQTIGLNTRNLTGNAASTLSATNYKHSGNPYRQITTTRSAPPSGGTTPKVPPPPSAYSGHGSSKEKSSAENLNTIISASSSSSATQPASGGTKKSSSGGGVSATSDSSFVAQARNRKKSMEKK